MKIDDAIAEINRYINEFHTEITKYASIRTLELIKNTFIVIKDNILSEHADSPTLSELHAISHYICDQWPHNTVVG